MFIICPQLDLSAGKSYDVRLIVLASLRKFSATLLCLLFFVSYTICLLFLLFLISCCFMFLTRTCLFINQKKIGQQNKPEIISNENLIEQRFGLAKWHCSFWYWNWGQPFQKTLAKAQQTRWLSALTKVTSLGHSKITSSYTNLDQNSAQNLDQASITKS